MRLRHGGGRVALGWPLAARTQQCKTWRIGGCHVGHDHTPPSLNTLRATLAELGYEDGCNLRLSCVDVGG